MSSGAARPDSIALIGGHLAIDLVNTVSWRPDGTRRRENLGAPADLLTWLGRQADPHYAAAERALATSSDGGEQILQDVRELRELLHDHLEDTIEHNGEQPELKPDTTLHQIITSAISRSGLAGAPAGWVPSARQPPVDFFAVATLDLLQTLPGPQLRRCEDDRCGWLFLDLTRNHRRRWCSSRDCGNRDRARRHYARHHETGR